MRNADDASTMAADFETASRQAFAAAHSLIRSSPYMAGALMHQLYYSPCLQRLRHCSFATLPPRVGAFMAQAEEIWLDRPRGRIRAYRWRGAEPVQRRILFVHGWTSQASDWLLPIRAVRSPGTEIFAYDHPAHGLSDNQHTSLPDCVDAFARVIDCCGPFDCIVAHSGGGAIVATALAGLIGTAIAPPAKLALLAPPASLRATMIRFAERYGFTGKVFEHFEARLDIENGAPVDRFDVAKAVDELPLALLHILAIDDEEIPHDESIAIRQQLGNARSLDVSADHAGLLLSRKVAFALADFAGAAKPNINDLDKQSKD